MTGIKPYILLVSVLIGSAQMQSQNSHYAGIFPTIDHSGQLNERVNYSLYYFAAFPAVTLKEPDVNTESKFLLFYSEQALTFKTEDHFSFTGSYVYQRANVVNENYVNENRFYLQAKYQHAVNKLNFSHRARLDLRFVQNRNTNKTPLTHRMRYLLGVDVPIKCKKDNLYFTMYEEFFFNTVNSGKPFYEENWAFLGLGIKLNKKNKIEPGVLYISWDKGNGGWLNQYYFQLTFINNIDFRN